MSIDCFLGRTYNKDNYNCAHFVVEVWEHLTGVNIEDKMAGFLLPVEYRFVPFSLRRLFKKLDKPTGLCIVLMQRFGKEPHVGLYYKNRVLHITKQGVQYMPLEIATLGFNKIGFYTC